MRDWQFRSEGPGWRWLLLVGLLLSTTAGAVVPVAKPVVGPATVRVVGDGGAYRLLVNGAPFRVKGAGLESGSVAELAARGGNAFRTWRSDNAKSLLDQAQAHGLMVALGIELGSERHGFNYSDNAAVAAQLAQVRSQVQRYKDHPALLMWVAGNELNLESSNPQVWDAINQIATMIHQIDPHHPVMTTLAGIDRPLIDQLKLRAPRLDLIGIQLYGDIENLQAKLDSSGWTGAYLVTEWGPTGHWEVPTTPWGAPIEDHSSRKAELLRDRYQQHIAVDQTQGLGSFVFLWGQKQERTPTWYGLFLRSGESTPGIDAMQALWTGSWPTNRSPAVGAIEIDGINMPLNTRLRAGRSYRARINTSDPEGDPLAIEWQVREESRAQSIGGDPESIPPAVPVGFTAPAPGVVDFLAPQLPGAYRLFVTVRDGQGHAGYANLPFLVELP